MAYDRNEMFEPVGVAALDPKVAAYKKFVKQNLGQPELLQFLQSEQGKQLDPNLAGAMIVLEQLEKARDRTPQGPPPKTSVIQDVGMAGLQKAQEAQMAQGLPQFPNPGMANAQFQGGIATPPQQMASGGIVAFTQGGPSSPVWTDAQEKRLNNLQNLMDAGYVFGAYGEHVTGVERSDELRAAQESAREEYLSLGKLKRQVEAAREEGKRQQRIAAERAKYLGEEPAAAPAPASAAKPAPQVAGPSTAIPKPPVEKRAINPLVEKRAINPPEETNIFGGSAVKGARDQISELKSSAENLRPQKDFGAYLADIQARNEKQGIGASATQYKDYLAKQESEIKSDFQKDRWLAVAEAGFAMANAAAQNPQAGFLGALSVGGMAGAKQYTASLKEYRKSLDQMQNAKFALAQSLEAQRREDSREAREELGKDRDRFDRAYSNYVTAATSLSSTLVGAETSNRIAAANREAAVNSNPENVAFNALVKGGMDPLKALEKVRETSPSVQSTQARLDAAQIIAKYGKDPSLKYASLQRKAQEGDPVATAQLKEMQLDLGIAANPFGLQIVPDDSKR